MKFRNILSIALLCGVGVYNAFGLEVTSDGAGYLSVQLKEDLSDVTSLTVKGNIDASDIFFLTDNMPALTSVDFQDAVIEAYRGESLHGRSTYPAATIPFGAFSGMGITSFVFPTQPGLVIADAAFVNTPLAELSIPENVDSIGQGAFAGCNELTTVTMPTCRMGDAVFSNCEKLETVIIGSAMVIPAATFRGCTSLTAVEGAENIVAIGERAFEGDTALTSFNFGKGIRTIGASAFAGTSLDKINLAEASELTEINDQTFADAALTEVSLPDGLTTIGNGAFFGNSTLTDIVLPQQIIAIGQHSFANTTLSSLELPLALEEIGDYALLGQSSIEELILPSSLIYIGDYAMEGMTGLRTIDARTLPEVPELGTDVWAGVDQKQVTLHLEPSSPDFENAPQWMEFIIDRPDGVNDAVVDNTDSAVRGRFYGNELQLESRGRDIDMVRLFDIAGRLLLTVEPHDTNVAIDTTDLQGNIFIVNVVLEDSTSATLKLGRR